MITVITWRLPIKIANEANSSEHWTQKRQRHKKQQNWVKAAFLHDKPGIVPARRDAQGEILALVVRLEHVFLSVLDVEPLYHCSADGLTVHVRTNPMHRARNLSARWCRTCPYKNRQNQTYETSLHSASVPMKFIIFTLLIEESGRSDLVSSAINRQTT